MSELVTQAEYARRRGVSREAVRVALEAKRITGIDRDGRVMVDPELADIEWARNTDPDQQHRGAPDQFATTQARAEEALRGGGDDEPRSGDEPEAPAAAATPDAPLLVEAKTQTEHLRRQLLELELAEKRGELVRVAEFERAYAAKLVAAREAFDALPDRLAAKLCAALGVDAALAARAHALLADEIRAAMLHLAASAQAQA